MTPSWLENIRFWDRKINWVSRGLKQWRDGLEHPGEVIPMRWLWRAPSQSLAQVAVAQAQESCFQRLQGGFDVRRHLGFRSLVGKQARHPACGERRREGEVERRA